MTDFLETKRKEISDRLKELEPLVDEHRRLEAAASALAGVDGSTPATATLEGIPASPKPTSISKPAAKRRRRGRRKGVGKRAGQALALIVAEPGITIPELAKKMKIQTNYLYRVLPGLEKEGKIRKEGRGWFPRNG